MTFDPLDFPEVHRGRRVSEEELSFYEALIQQEQEDDLAMQDIMTDLGERHE